MADNSKEQDFAKRANENSVDVLIRRFKSGDPEVMYEKIQVSLIYFVFNLFFIWITLIS